MIIYIKDRIKKDGTALTLVKLNFKNIFSRTETTVFSATQHNLVKYQQLQPDKNIKRQI